MDNFFNEIMYNKYLPYIISILKERGVPSSEWDDIIQNVFLDLLLYDKKLSDADIRERIFLIIKWQIYRVTSIRRFELLVGCDFDFTDLPLIFCEEDFKNSSEMLTELVETKPEFKNGIKSILEKNKDIDIYEALIKGDIVDKYGNVITSKDSSVIKQIETDISVINQSFMMDLANNPSRIYNLTSYQFEEVIAELFRKLNYEVTVTPKTRDGGIDIYLANNNEIGAFLFIVQCKKYSRKHPVGVSVIREIVGIQTVEQYTGSIIVTSSYFTRVARNYIKEKKLEHIISLKDYSDICRLLKKYYLC